MFLPFLKTSPRSFYFFSLIGLSLMSCQEKERRGQMPAEVSSFVYAYTSGIISKTDPIRVRFTSSAVGEEEIGSTAEGIIRFKPDIPGQASWEDDKTLLFEPSKYLKSGTSFVGTVLLKKLFSNAGGVAAEFAFDFRTRDQGFSVEIEGLQAQGPNELSKQKLDGTIFTTDLAENEEVEKTLKAEQRGSNLAFSWEHSGDGTEHRFLISGIRRGNKPGKVALSWNGDALNVDKKGRKEVEIPALGDFKVTDVQVVQQATQYIRLHLSDPLRKAQNLGGLVAISDYSGKLDFTIEGNEIRIYPASRLTGTHTIQVRPGIRNINKTRMQKPSIWTVAFEEMKPAVRLVGRGVIMPNSDGLIFPFEAVSLNAVEVEVFKIFDNNILQFLQSNELDGNYDMQRVGRVILQEKVPLKNLNPNANTASWTRYALDLSKLMEQDPNAIYQLRIGFRPEYSTWFCGTSAKSSEDKNLTVMEAGQLEGAEIKSFWGGWYGIDGYYNDYRWEDREDPCRPAYYNYENFVLRNVIASDLGIIAKGGKDGSMFVAVSNLKTAEPASGATLEFFDYQQQFMASATTNSEGIAQLDLKRTPFAVVASLGAQKGYLKLLDGNALSMSRFDVAGAVAQKGLKGFIYGDRGVWRPGDSLFLNFILDDKSGKLPANHPITFELYDPRGQLQQKRVTTENVDDLYPLPIATSLDAPTGNWTAKVKVGGAHFSKILKIETVKPNRLKINLDFGKEILSAKDEPLEGKLQINWLHGAPAQNLETVVEVEVRQTNTTFEHFPDYEFDDPARRLTAEPVTLFDGKTDQDGAATFRANIYNNNRSAAGKLKANFKTRAFEKGGDFSTWNSSYEYNPYEAYAGIRIPKNEYEEQRINMNQDGKIKFVAVDEKGNPLNGKELTVGLYRVEWRWWWDRSWDDVSRFNSSQHLNSLQKTTLTTNNKGETSWTVNVNDWGRYLVRVCDSEGGHCAGDYFYSGYPWYDEDGNGRREEAAMMSFSSEKKKYQVGETIVLKVPAGNAGRVLVTLENGAGVMESFWKKAIKGENTFRIEAMEEMAPTVYAFVTLVQPHAQVENDLPIRMYGVLPIAVENPDTKLTPVLKMPNELKPEKKFTIEVSEKHGDAMAYSIAIVDDGLLDLTRFRTPDPHAAFYAREALGVKTWDVYDYVLGACGGELERILSIGGDGEIEAQAAKKNANRFKPVVLHAGPFYLKKGKKAKHEFTMPNYVGSVRAMVVAANHNEAYGNAEKTVPVRKPLMALATLPRVLGPEEELKMPVNIFAMDKKVKKVTIKIEESSGLVEIIGGASKTLNFSRPGDDLVYFDLKVKREIGIAKFKVTAKGGGETAKQEIELDIRNPNPYVTNVFAGIMESGEDWTQNFQPLGIRGTNKGLLEVSNIPPINLGKRLNFLIRYPHGCIEQTISSGFPQLYLDKLIQLDEGQKKRVPQNIEACIERLKYFQLSNGGFTYWPGGSYSDWGTTYGLHFLLEARALGYSVPSSMLDRLVKYQKKTARHWQPAKPGIYKNLPYPDFSQLAQAYRLFTLALAKSPELGGMNRLREMKNLGIQASWRLAAAYALLGKPEVALELVKNLPTEVNPYTQMSYSYGSDLRDEAMILETLVLMGENKAAAGLARQLSEKLSQNRWYSTQTIAYSLLAIGKLVGESGLGDKFDFAYRLGDGKWVNAGSTHPIMSIEVPVELDASNRSLSVKNSGTRLLYARLILTGQPVIGDQTAAAEDLQITINYRTTTGERINPGNIPQGSDFIAEVVVTNPGKRGIRYEEMALTQIFPSGWEILNTRMDNFTDFSNSTKPEYQDIRDDRIYSYFDIGNSTHQVYRVQLNAAYQGRYYLPTVSCEAMYDNSINARVPGQWVEVVAPKEL